MSTQQHAGKRVTVTTDAPLYGQIKTTVDFLVEDYWTAVSGGTSWMAQVGNPACLNYAVRVGLAGLPVDNDVVYGKTPDGLGHLVHVSEIVEGGDQS